jgi:hypothetical protein
MVASPYYLSRTDHGQGDVGDLLVNAPITDDDAVFGGGRHRASLTRGVAVVLKYLFQFQILKC